VDALNAITHRFDLDSYDEALAAVADSHSVKTVLVPNGRAG